MVLWVAGALIVSVGLGFLIARVMQPSIPAFDGGRALNDIRTIVDFGPRVPGTQAHADALAFLRGRLDTLADQVSLQPVSLVDRSGDTLHGTNIVASFNLAPSKNVRIMLGAHWDSRPYADQDPDSANWRLPVPGTDDGASGNAVLLEVARLLHENPVDVGVDILLFDLEDAGIDTTVPFAAGSEQFAASNPQYRPAFGIVADMVCGEGMRLLREANSWRAARRIVELVWKAAETENASAFVDELGGSVNDDHIPFLRRGIPVIDLIPSPFPDHWHTLGDTPDKCSPESLDQVGRVITRVLYTQ